MKSKAAEAIQVCRSLAKYLSDEEFELLREHAEGLLENQTELFSFFGARDHLLLAFFAGHRSREKGLH